MYNCKKTINKNKMIYIDLKEHKERPEEYTRKVTGYGTPAQILKELNKHLINDISALILDYSKEKNIKVPLVCCKDNDPRPLMVGDIVYKEEQDAFESFPYVVIKKGYKYIYTKRLKPAKIKPQKNTGMVKLKYRTTYLHTFSKIYKNFINSNDYKKIKPSIITFNTYTDPTAYYEDEDISKQMDRYCTFF